MLTAISGTRNKSKTKRGGTALRYHCSDTGSNPCRSETLFYLFLNNSGRFVHMTTTTADLLGIGHVNLSPLYQLHAQLHPLLAIPRIPSSCLPNPNVVFVIFLSPGEMVRPTSPVAAELSACPCNTPQACRGGFIHLPLSNTRSSLLCFRNPFMPRLREISGQYGFSSVC